MGDGGPVRAPDDVPRSPTGRVPQWVLDEAAGRAVGPVPFRGSTITPGLRLPDGAPGTRSPDRPRPGRTVRLAAAIAFASGLAAVGLHLQGVSSVPTAATQDRAQAPAPRPDRPPPGLDESPEPLGTPPAAPVMSEGDDYRFLATSGDGRPVTWSPCRPIRYVVRRDGAPPGGGAMIAQAVAGIEAATGLDFEDVGPTSEAPSQHRKIYQRQEYGDRWAPVLIAWATPEEVPELGAEDVVGRGGPVHVGTASGERAHVSGAVYLDARDILQLVAAAGPAVGRAVVLHELGHLVGLAHVDNAAEIMAPRGTDVTELGRGDRAGLAALGRGPCQPDA